MSDTPTTHEMEAAPQSSNVDVATATVAGAPFIKEPYPDLYDHVNIEIMSYLTDGVYSKCIKFSRSGGREYNTEVHLYQHHLKSIQDEYVPFLVWCRDRLSSPEDKSPFILQLPHQAYWSNMHRGKPESVKREVINAYTAIHRCGVLHDAVHFDNIHIGADNSVRITNFGNSRIWKPDPRAPEIQTCTSDELDWEIRRVRVYIRYLDYFEKELEIWMDGDRDFWLKNEELRKKRGVHTLENGLEDERWDESEQKWKLWDWRPDLLDWAAEELLYFRSLGYFKFPPWHLRFAEAIQPEPLNSTAPSKPSTSCSIASAPLKSEPSSPPPRPDPLRSDKYPSISPSTDSPGDYFCRILKEYPNWAALYDPNVRKIVKRIQPNPETNLRPEFAPEIEAINAKIVPMNIKELHLITKQNADHHYLSGTMRLMHRRANLIEVIGNIYRFEELTNLKMNSPETFTDDHETERRQLRRGLKISLSRRKALTSGMTQFLKLKRRRNVTIEINMGDINRESLPPVPSLTLSGRAGVADKNTLSYKKFAVDAANCAWRNYPKTPDTSEETDDKKAKKEAGPSSDPHTAAAQPIPPISRLLRATRSAAVAERNEQNPPRPGPVESRPHLAPLRQSEAGMSTLPPHLSQPSMPTKRQYPAASTPRKRKNMGDGDHPNEESSQSRKKVRITGSPTSFVSHPYFVAMRQGRASLDRDLPEPLTSTDTRCPVDSTSRKRRDVDDSDSEDEGPSQPRKKARLLSSPFTLDSPPYFSAMQQDEASASTWVPHYSEPSTSANAPYPLTSTSRNLESVHGSAGEDEGPSHPPQRAQRPHSPATFVSHPYFVAMRQDRASASIQARDIHEPPTSTDTRHLVASTSAEGQDVGDSDSEDEGTSHPPRRAWIPSCLLPLLRS